MPKKRLHILFINSWYPSKLFPTNGDFIQRHAQAVSEKHKVTCVHFLTNPQITKNEYTSHIHGNLREIIFYLKPVYHPVAKIKNYLTAFRASLKLVENFDIVHVNRLYPAGIFALYLKYFKKKQYIISEHFTGYLKPNSKNIPKWELFLSGLIVKDAGFVCPVSKNLKLNMQELGLKGNYSVVPNVVDTSVFHPVEKKNNRFVIVHVSSLADQHKNISGLLQGIRKFQDEIPDFLFYLLGENPFRYNTLIDSLKINPDNIVLVDQIPHEQVASYLQKSDVLVLFSNYENLPCVILEAFASGIKVISTDVGGIKEYFPEDFGLLIPPRDTDKLVDALKKMHKNHEKTKAYEMHEYAKKQFGKKIIAAKFEQLYFKLLKNVG